VYLCICNALSYRTIRVSIATPDVERVARVFEACGCLAQCGTWVGEIAAPVAERRESAPILAAPSPLMAAE
jgi:bacterioferritin-associated ferredoxin